MSDPCKTAHEYIERRLQERHKLVRINGGFHYWPEPPDEIGAISAEELRIMADELDAYNKKDRV
jgi:hypothetical protein